MRKKRYIQLSTVLLMGVVAGSTFCGVTAHHMESMPNMSPSCSTGYFLAALPQSSQERGALFTFLSILVLLALFLIVRTRTRDNSIGESRSVFLFPENARGHDPLMELFRRGILNPKIYNLALMRS